MSDKTTDPSLHDSNADNGASDDAALPAASATEPQVDPQALLATLTDTLARLEAVLAKTGAAAGTIDPADREAILRIVAGIHDAVGDGDGDDSGEPQTGPPTPDPRSPEPPSPGDSPPAPGLFPIPLPVAMARTKEAATPDVHLWKVIQDRCNALSFNNYKTFMDRVMCDQSSDDRPADLGDDRIAELRARLRRVHGVHGRDAYELLRLGTEEFLTQQSRLLSDAFLQDPDGLTAGPASAQKRDQLARELRDKYLVDLSEQIPGNDSLPLFAAIRQGMGELPIKGLHTLALGTDANCYGILPSQLMSPCLIELIHDYWLEQAGLWKTMNAISLRFQNKRSPRIKNALDRMAISPLRPLNNLLWGFIEKQGERLSLSRRNYEYDHHYGISLGGKALSKKLQSIDSRSGFLRAFHTLLNLCAQFFKEEDDATIFADGFPILNALKEVHLLLAQGDDNQRGNMPSACRVETLIFRWLLARPEMREFLGNRASIPYQEPWMGRVETMRKLQSWGDTPVHHFRDLAVYGEQILLSIRFGNWSQVHQREQAASWAEELRNQLLGYIHAYRATTGVDLTKTVDFTMPSVHLARRRA